MANQIIIDIGAVANDGTGDPLRTAFGYVNNNFSNIWATGVANSNIQFDGNRILTTNTNGNLVLAPNGIGKVQANVDIVPNANNALSLGSLTRQWNTVYAQNLAVAGNVAFNNLSVFGNLTVSGDIIQMGNIVTDSKTIQLANTAGTDAAANGSGITVGANDNIATLLYNSSSDVWTTNIGLTVTGNITGTYFVGNGSLLTGITSYGNANAVAYGESGWAGNIVPSGNAVYSLGNATNQWNDLYVSNATIFMNNVPISLTAGNVLTVNGEAVLTNDSATTITTTGNITADYLFGNGSQLTGISTADIGDIIFNNTTISAPAGDRLTIQALDNDDIVRSQLVMDGDNDVTRLSSWSSQNNQYFDTGSWATGTYTTEGGGSIGAVQFTDAQAIIDWLNANGDADNFFFSVNSGPQLASQGYSAGGSNVTFYVTALPDPNPTAVTTFEIYYQYQSLLEIDYDDEEFLIQAVESDLVLETRSAGDINIYSVNDLSMQGNGFVSLRNSRTDNGILIQTDTNNTNRTWEFDATGNLTLPQSGVIYETNIPYGGLSGKTIALLPQGGTSADQQLLVYPTAGADYNHLHLTSGNLYNTELFLGSDDLYVKLANTGNIVINSNDGNSNTAQWTFGTAGTILNSGNLTLQTPNGVPGAVTAITGSSGSWEANPRSNLATTGGTGSGLTVNVAETGGYASAIAIATAGTGYSNGDSISVVSGSSDASFTISVLANGWTLDTAGNLTVAGSIIMPPNSVLTGTNASPAPSINGFDTISGINFIADNISLTNGRINGGEATVVADGINSIALAPGAQMDLFGFPFASGTSRGQLTITGNVSTIGTTQALGTWYYQSVNTYTYQLYTDSTYSTLVDASGWTAYNGGASVAITLQDPLANIVINSNGYLTKFDNTGNLTLPNGGNLVFSPTQVQSSAYAGGNGHAMMIDTNRTDDYVEIGSADKPFKTFAAAIAAVAELNPDGTVPYTFILMGCNINETVDFTPYNFNFITISTTCRSVFNDPVIFGNSDLLQLTVRNVEFGDTVTITGDGTTNQLNNTSFYNTSFTGAVTVTAANSLAFYEAAFFSTVTFNNVNYVYVNGGQFNSDWTIRADNSGAYPVPSNGITPGQIIALDFIANNIIFVKGGTGTYVFQPQGSRMGLSAGTYTLPAGWTLSAYSSVFRGTWTNNGTWTMRNSSNDNAIAGTAPTYTGTIGGAIVTATGNITGGNLTVGSGTITGGNVNGANFNGNVAFGTGTVGGSGNISGGNISAIGNITGNTAGFTIGYRDIPQVSFTGNATIATTDAGKHFYSTQSSNYTLTIANNASQGFQVGAAITVVNQGSGTISIAQGSGVILYLAGNVTAGNRSVATFGMATIMKVATDTWFINGTGVS